MYTFIARLFSRIWILVLPLGLTLFSEFLNRGSASDTFAWIGQHTASFFLAYLIVVALYLLLIAIIGSGKLSFWILTALLLIVTAISGSKMKAIGAPLFPWDVYFHNEDVHYREFLSHYVTFRIVSYTVLFLLVSYLLLRILIRRSQTKPPVRLLWVERGVYAVISIVLITSLYSDKPIPFKSIYKIGTVPWDQTLTYGDNGFLLSSMLMKDFVRTDKPDGYSKEAIRSLINSIPTNKPVSKENPNIIVMLSEAFWDPTIMKNVTFSKDPIPFLHELQQSYTSGWMLSPQFGGSTANVEFEVLSSNSMRLLPLSPDSVLPYLEYMNHGVDSLASIMARKGYTSTAINPFFSWFFDSRKVYKHFGFSRFISSEFFPNDFEGPNYADRTVASKIIEETEKNPGPDFVFANTMENHAPFVANKFSSNEIQVSGDITPLSKGMLESYAHGISDADKSLQTLVDYYTKKGEPTIILFFGDHMPFLDDDYKVYRDAKYLLKDDPDFLTKTHNTPFVIWNNYLPAGKEDLHISPSFLGPYMLHMAGLEGSYYTDYLYELYKKIPVLPPESNWKNMNISENDVKGYRMLEYDNLFGKRYGYEMKGYKDSIVDPTYTLGYGNPVITGAIPDAKVIKITGKRFFPQTKVFLDGHELASDYISETSMAAELPNDVKLGSGQTHHLEVRLIDDKKTLIGQSNIWLLE